MELQKEDLIAAAKHRSFEGDRTSSAAVEAYSFSRAGQISNEQMRAISLLNDMFARNLTHNLGAWLRTTFQVSLVSAEQLPFNEFTMRIPEVAYVGSVRLEPLGALSVLQLDLSLAPPVIDLLLGGEGKPGIVRELTDIEESILGSVVEVVCRELSSAWQSVGLSFTFEKRQLQTQIARIMPVKEKTLCLSFEIQMPEARGLLNLAFPAVVSNTILRRLIGNWGRQRRHSLETRQRVRERCAMIRLGTVLQLPPLRIAARELESLQPGKIVSLNMPLNHPAELRAAGVPLFEARPVSDGEYRGAHLLSPHAQITCELFA
jgi:flagellar motor switch protein FliM